jgi:hypothetical protein
MNFIEHLGEAGVDAHRSLNPRDAAAYAQSRKMTNLRMLQLVTELCSNVPGHEGRETRATFKIEIVKEDTDYEEPNEMVTEQESESDYEEPFPVDTAEPFDEVLASPLEMGFVIEDASRAIRGCGRLDIAAAVEHMNRLVLPEDALTAPNGTIRIEEEGQHFSDGGSRVAENHARA